MALTPTHPPLSRREKKSVRQLVERSGNDVRSCIRRVRNRRQLDTEIFVEISAQAKRVTGSVTRYAAN